ncbi:MAG: rhamnulokinase [Eubacteriales bacterium]|nr:rhamnulokinase [Eubacteriales bacterium]
MAINQQVLAFDFGASSGRAMLGRFNGQTIELEEIHRFSNDPVRVGSTLYWDVLRLFFEIKQGLIKAKTYGVIESLGIDTWGVDFGLIDHEGRLLENPVHYRDTRTLGVMDQVFSVVPRRELYNRTGIQFMNFNTLFQLYALKMQRPDLLERVSALLLMPDLFIYLLTGVRQSEYTMASTGQLLDAKTGRWDESLIKKLDLPRAILQPLVTPGQAVGSLSATICDELGVLPLQVIAVGGHDTASAVVAVPAETNDFVYISSGTWSLMGIETKEPILNDLAYDYQFTNEGGYDQTIRFLKNIMGLWLIQESRRQWQREGQMVSFADMEKAALASEPFKCLIDPDNAILSTPGDMPGRIRDLCRTSGQPIPETTGEVVRCIYESLALKYRQTKEQIETMSGRTFPAIHVVGGGTKDGLLSQFTADATGSRVIAGPIEATALGNIAVQLIAAGSIKNLAHARQIIAASFPCLIYEPTNTHAWDLAYLRFQDLLNTRSAE